MKEFTNEEKLDIYVLALKTIKEDIKTCKKEKGNDWDIFPRGLCARIGEAARALHKNLGSTLHSSMKHRLLFPEFWKFKPEDERSSVFWWPIGFNGPEKRIDVLEQLISNLKSKNNV